MAPSQSTRPTSDQRLNAIIADYLEAVECGEHPDRAVLLADHPDLAEELREFLDADAQMRAATAALRDASAAPSSASFGDYEVIEELGRGGMGVVFKARQRSLKRRVALKTLLAGQFSSDEELRRFRTEAESAARLSHPNIVPVFEVGEQDRHPFFSMELVDGANLGDLVRDNPLPPDDAARYVCAVARAIQYAHDRGVLHRDLKPSNVIIDSATDQPRVTDFGLAKLQGNPGDGSLTATGAIVGTPSYMSPEQTDPKLGEVAQASDIYSIGAMLYEALTGRPPFRGDTPFETIALVQKSEPIPLRVLDPKLPADLETICLRCLEKDPSSRYETAGDLADELQRFLDGEPIHGEPFSHAERVFRWVKRSTALVRIKTSASMWGLVIGPAVALLLGFGPSWGLPLELSPGRPGLNTMAALVALMAIWWVTEAVPVAATALLPLILFPALGVMEAPSVASIYGSNIIFLFLGGFLVAIAIEDSGLPRRVALAIVTVVGDRPRRVVLGFMGATAVMSMWISNTASTIIMLPIATSVLSQMSRPPERRREARNFGIALMLGIAYAATIGGTATLIGTPPNLALVEEAKRIPELHVTFAGWMKLGMPFAFALIAVAWLLLVYRIYPVGRESFFGGEGVIRQELKKLGPMRQVEWRASAVFAATALLWVFREPVRGWGWAPALGLEVTDATVAIFMALVCFVLPAGSGKGQRLLEWKSAVRVPWGVLLLFGGGLALARGMRATELDEYLGDGLAALLAGMPSALSLSTAVAAIALLAALARLRSRRRQLADNEQLATPVPLPSRQQAYGPIVALAAGCIAVLWIGEHTGMLLATTAGMAAMTELMTNLASVQMLLPVLAEASRQLGVHPGLLLTGATLAASCAFMLPVATAPNAIVFGSGRMRMRHMIRAGLWLNVLAVLLVVVLVSLLAG
jgi:sodium-dependent dicarboxylate transporter 2/3/5